MASGRGERWTPYYVVGRLLGLAEDYWVRFDGWCAASGFDPLEMTFDRMLNVLEYWATLDAEETDLKKWEARLWRPPKGEAPAAGSAWSPEAETSAFAALKKQTGG